MTYNGVITASVLSLS